MIQLEILLQNKATSVLKPRIANNVLEDLSKQHIWTEAKHWDLPGPQPASPPESLSYCRLDLADQTCSHARQTFPVNKTL